MFIIEMSGDMSFVNTTEGDRMGEESGEPFHIYILSFSYGFLL